MRPVPPRALETVVGWLIPPACREEVLGDLHERYVSPRQYLLDAVSTVPLVIASQIRRKPAAYQAMRGAALAGAAACLSQIVIWAVNGGLLVPRQMLIFGASLSVLLLSVLRMVFQCDGKEVRHVMSGGAAPRGTAEGSRDMSLDEIRRKSKEIQRKAWRGTLGLLLAIILVVAMVFFLNDATPHTRGGRIVSVATAAVALFVAYQIFRTRPGGSVPPGAALATSVEVYRAQLERRRNTLRGIWLWYAGPVLGIMLAFALRFPLAHLDQPGLWLNVAPFSVLAVGWAGGLVYLSQREAREVQREMEALEGAEKGRS